MWDNKLERVLNSQKIRSKISNKCRAFFSPSNLIIRVDSVKEGEAHENHYTGNRHAGGRGSRRIARQLPVSRSAEAYDAGRKKGGKTHEARHFALFLAERIKQTEVFKKKWHWATFFIVICGTPGASPATSNSPVLAPIPESNPALLAASFPQPVAAAML